MPSGGPAHHYLSGNPLPSISLLCHPVAFSVARHPCHQEAPQATTRAATRYKLNAHHRFRTRAVIRFVFSLHLPRRLDDMSGHPLDLQPTPVVACQGQPHNPETIHVLHFRWDPAIGAMCFAGVCQRRLRVRPPSPTPGLPRPRPPHFVSSPCPPRRPTRATMWRVARSRKSAARPLGPSSRGARVGPGRPRS